MAQLSPGNVAAGAGLAANHGSDELDALWPAVATGLPQGQRPVRGRAHIGVAVRVARGTVAGVVRRRVEVG